jgi:site-specific DNA-methyltransferase (adenine-specific)
MGSGQTALAALKGERHYVGYEIDNNYVRLANRRIHSFLAEVGQPTRFSGKNQTMEGQ